MTQVKTYRIGTYEWVNGKLVLKQHNRTYRQKPTKHIEKINEKRKEVRRGMAVIVACFVILAMQITNSFEIEAEGATVGEVIVTAVAPTDYEGIPYITKIEPSVEEQIRLIAAEKDFKWPDYLVRLANCESKLNPKAINDKNRNGSIDWGLFQWNSELPPIPITKDCAMDVRCSTEKTIEAINMGLQDHWVCNDMVLNK